MKTLIYSGVFCQDEDNREIVKLWGRLVAHLNPDVDILVFDSCSPFKPELFLHGDISIHHFEDNPGHLSRGGGDGAGRTFCAGIDHAMQNGYDYCVHIESDMFLARPVMPLIERMHKASVKAAACLLPQYQFPEFGICAFNTLHMSRIDFTHKYNWKEAPKWPIPERRVPDLLGDDLWIIPWYGTRNDQNQLNHHNMPGAFPYAPPDFITRVNIQTAMKFLELNNIELP